MDAYFNNKKIFEILNKWKKELALVAISAIILGTIISFLIKPIYRSNAILYPINLPTLSAESKTEQMLQILQSIDIRKKIYKSFNLASHYKIDTLATSYFTMLNDEFDRNSSFSKTEFEGVEIEVLDVNPIIASHMVDSIIKYYNEKVESLHKRKNFEMVTIKGQEMAKKKTEIDSLEKKQKDMKVKYGIIDIPSQTKELTRGYMNLMAAGKKGSEAGKEIDTLLRNFKERAEEFNRTGGLLWAAQNQFNALKDEYEKNLTEVQKKITYAIIVSAPYPADKRTSPVRSLVVLFVTLSAICAAFVVIGFLESRVKK